MVAGSAYFGDVSLEVGVEEAEVEEEEEDELVCCSFS